jgi:phosphate transport system protein
MPSEHTYKQFDAELEAIRAQVLKMGGLVEEQFIHAIEALVSGDMDLADRVEQRDREVNTLDVAIDEEAAHIIALRQPTASDLRLIMTVIKTTTDLERAGDEAAKIARMAKRIHNSERMVVPRFTQVRYMSEIALEMLKSALDSFARLDASVAAGVARQDMRLDEEFHLETRHLITYMMEDPRTISTFIDMTFVAKAIERIGDHAKNMSEYVVYMVKGKDVRHTTLEDLEKIEQGE